MSAPVPGGLTAAAPEEMRIPCVTLMASIPWNLFLYGIEVKSDTHLFQSDVGSLCANARSCWIEGKLSGLTFAYFFFFFKKDNLYIYVLNSKNHCIWFNKSQCLSCSNVFFISTSLVIITAVFEWDLAVAVMGIPAQVGFQAASSILGFWCVAVCEKDRVQQC